ncbi:MAG: diguanylate cyclase [Acidobacteriota bacterium]
MSEDEAVTRILLVEDDRDDAAMLRHMLQRAGEQRLELEHVGRLSGALERLEQGGIDVVLLDLGLPDSFGLETFTALNLDFPQVPALVLSGLDNETLALKAVREGAQDYLVKGDFGHPLLLRAIRYAIERHRLQESLRSLSLEDDLTGLYNRRAFLHLAEQQLRMARRHNTPVLLLFADLDGLKAINDQHGHTAGSRAIVDTATVLRETFRDSDIVARFGGDEFVILLPETEVSTFAVPAGRLRANLEAFNRRGARPFHLALSLGAAAFDPRQPCALEELIEQADQAMYDDKRRKGSAR